jgi:hypothetical protein
MDTSPVFQLSEHILNVMTLSVEHWVVRDMDLPVGLGGDTGGGFAISQRLAEPVAVIAFVRDHDLGPGQVSEH